MAPIESGARRQVAGRKLSPKKRGCHVPVLRVTALLLSKIAKIGRTEGQ